MNEFEKIGYFLRDNGLKLSTAESCTAGLISSSIAQVSGSSNWFEAGFIVYSPDAKHKMLGVSLETIEKFNITSTQVAEEMALGALKNSLSNVSISTTGVAGPNGGTEDIPVGTVCFGWAFNRNGKIEIYSEKKLFQGNRNEIRQQAALYGLHQIEHYFYKTLDKSTKIKPK